MASGLLTGAVIGGIFTLIGSLGTGYLNIRRAKIEQNQQDKRIIAQHFAAQEAESIRELNYQLNRCHRLYEEAVRQAATQILTDEQFKEEYHKELENLQEEIEKSSAFLNKYGERELRDYLQHLFKAESYAREKSKVEDELSIRNGEIKELLKEDNAEIRWNQWHRDYQDAKNALRNAVGERLELLSMYESKTGE